MQGHAALAFVPAGALCLLLVGCNPLAEDQAIQQCEKALTKRLKSPSSYKRVEASIYKNTVNISYDAANSFNAMIRGYKQCEFTALSLISASFLYEDEVEYEGGFKLKVPYFVDGDKTKLEFSEDDKARRDCANAVAKQSGSNLPVLLKPETVQVASVDGKRKVYIRSEKPEDYPSFAECTVADGGSIAVNRIVR